MSAFGGIDAILPEMPVPQWFPQTGRAWGKLWVNITGPGVPGTLGPRASLLAQTAPRAAVGRFRACPVARGRPPHGRGC